MCAVELLFIIFYIFFFWVCRKYHQFVKWVTVLLNRDVLRKTHRFFFSSFAALSMSRYDFNDFLEYIFGFVSAYCVISLYQQMEVVSADEKRSKIQETRRNEIVCVACGYVQYALDSNNISSIHSIISHHRGYR